MTNLGHDAKQIAYRDARSGGNYDGIWQNVGKCVFCDLRDKYILREENGIALTITLFAYIDGHLMIVPRRHVESPKEFTPEEWETVRKFMYLAKKMIRQAHGIKGVQFVQKDGVAAQSTVGHIHYHAIPFDSPDLSTWHFRKLANTPLQNVAVYKKLGKKIDELAQKYDEKYKEQTVTSSTDPYEFDWADLAFGSKKPLNELNATFIAAPRQISTKRFTQLVKTYLPKGNIVLGLAKEKFVDGFDDQPQFVMLQAADVQKIIDKVNVASPKHKIYTLRYAQRDAQFIFQKVNFAQVILVNGSWHRSFHTRPEYYTLTSRNIPFSMVSPFTSEDEAREYEAAIMPAVQQFIKPPTGVLTDVQMLAVAKQAAAGSFATDYQTGVALGKPTKNGYTLLATTYNKVVPFQTYAMHYGALREKHLSPPNDINFYDANHAEIMLIITAAAQGIDLTGTTLFINLLPCPACARMFCQTPIAEFVYSIDHSDGYAFDLLTKAGKKVRRLV